MPYLSVPPATEMPSLQAQTHLIHEDMSGQQTQSRAAPSKPRRVLLVAHECAFTVLYRTLMQSGWSFCSFDTMEKVQLCSPQPPPPPPPPARAPIPPWRPPLLPHSNLCKITPCSPASCSILKKRATAKSLPRIPELACLYGLPLSHLWPATAAPWDTVGTTDTSDHVWHITCSPRPLLGCCAPDTQAEKGRGGQMAADVVLITHQQVCQLRTSLDVSFSAIIEYATEAEGSRRWGIDCAGDAAKVPLGAETMEHQILSVRAPPSAVSSAQRGSCSETERDARSAPPRDTARG